MGINTLRIVGHFSSAHLISVDLLLSTAIRRIAGSIRTINVEDGIELNRNCRGAAPKGVGPDLVRKLDWICRGMNNEIISRCCGLDPVGGEKGMGIGESFGEGMECGGLIDDLIQRGEGVMWAGVDRGERKFRCVTIGEWVWGTGIIPIVLVGEEGEIGWGWG